jgi:type I pantothenate kinase
MVRKGFPESYDTARLVRFVADLKAGLPDVRAPLYAHDVYDIVPGGEQAVQGADVVIIEGLNVLQAEPRAGRGGAVFPSDFLDFSIYVDAAEEDILEWYVARFRTLQRTAFQKESSYFHEYASIDAERARALAERFWWEINSPNLHDHILPTRDRATLVLTKGSDHRVSRVRLRKR